MQILKMDKKPSILVVDDHRMMLTLAGNILEVNNFEVLYAQNADEAIQILNTNPIDLILLDIIMPGLNGFQLCQKIKETNNWKDIPIIFLSALSNSSDIVKGFQQGGVDFITKPFQREEFIARINKHLETKKMHDQYMIQMEDLRRTNRYLMGTMHEMAKVMEEAR